MEAAQKNPTPRILIVDDDEMIHKLLGAILHKAGFEPLSARSGSEGLELARTSCPELIILDIMMPGMNGFEVMRALKSDSGTASIPVIFLSGKFHNREKTQARDLGAADFMEKPFERNELLARVKTYLTLRRQEDSLSFYNSRIVQMAREALGLLNQGPPAEISALPEKLAAKLEAASGEAMALSAQAENQWVVFSAYIKPFLAGQPDDYFRETLALIPQTITALRLQLETIDSISRQFKAVSGLNLPAGNAPELPS